MLTHIQTLSLRLFMQSTFWTIFLKWDSLAIQTRKKRQPTCYQFPHYLVSPDFEDAAEAHAIANAMQ